MPTIYPRLGYIYLITNTVNGKCYVGKTTQKPEKRFYQHRLHAIHGMKCVLHRAIRKYDESSFQFDVIFACFDKEDLDSFEQDFIKEYDCCALDGPDKGYNMTRGGSDGTFVGNTQRKLVASGKHHSTTEASRARFRDQVRARVADGTHNFCDKTDASRRAHERMSKGTHASQVARTCPHCNKSGFGTSMLLWHFDKCKSSPNYIPHPKKTIAQSQKDALMKASTRKWRVVFPDGSEVDVENISKFSKEHDLCHSKMSAVALGKRKHHKKFKCFHLD